MYPMFGWNLGAWIGDWELGDAMLTAIKSFSFVFNSIELMHAKQ